MFSMRVELSPLLWLSIIVSDIIIHNAPTSITEKLKSLAAAHGISEGEELLLVLKRALSSEPAQMSMPKEFPVMTEPDDLPDWYFDRGDMRYGQQHLPPGEDFKAHLLALGDCGADILLERPRDDADHRRVEF